MKGKSKGSQPPWLCPPPGHLLQPSCLLTPLRKETAALAGAQAAFSLPSAVPCTCLPQNPLGLLQEAGCFLFLVCLLPLSASLWLPHCPVSVSLIPSPHWSMRTAGQGLSAHGHRSVCPDLVREVREVREKGRVLCAGGLSLDSPAACAQDKF
jgi:hypothetical protein